MSGPRAAVRARYPAGVVGRAIRRRDLDAWLLNEAVRAGVRFEDGWIAREPLIEQTADAWRVRGLVLERRAPHRARLRLPASMVIAADGRRSAVARTLGLVAHPQRPRRWAFGAYATGITGTSDLGEMHVRCGYYVGIAPLGDEVCNVCLVTGPRPEGATPSDVIHRAIQREPRLAPRFAGAAFAGPVRVLGPLAADARAAGAPGLLLAGDAAGFVDPMTGDGLHLAMQSAVLSAAEALRALETGDIAGAVERLGRARDEELGKKLRFNRAVRRLVDSRTAISLAEWGARLNPRVLARLVSYAGDAA
jgi:flavin-dependent dehydrogenase